MNRIIFTMILLAPLAVAGCSSKAGTASLGALGGAAAGGGVYEYRLNSEMDRIESEYKAGRMDKKEYEARKDQIRRVQIIK
ncbi:MAG: hypothetical protein EHM36_16315 [Deltaproteobacteria bacterium]|nr:MAG: hypothetical protein EHM36_16315 [Deltaproteobacteria bacterium]